MYMYVLLLVQEMNFVLLERRHCVEGELQWTRVLSHSCIALSMRPVIHALVIPERIWPHTTVK